VTNDESAFREVDQSLAEDRQWEFFSQNAPMVIGAASVIVLAVGSWQFMKAQQKSAAENAAIEFRDVVVTLEKTPDEGREALSAFAADAPDGYGVLAQFRQAASLARSGAREDALVIYREIYEDGRASKRLTDLARIRASYLSISDGRDAVLRDIGALSEDGSAFGAYAREIVGVAALAAEDFETAQSMFERATLELTAPENIRLRAEEFAALAAAGKAGVNLTGAAQAEDLVKALERGGDPADAGAAIDDHEGHGHETGETAAQEGASGEAAIADEEIDNGVASDGPDGQAQDTTIGEPSTGDSSQTKDDE